MAEMLNFHIIMLYFNDIRGKKTIFPETIKRIITFSDFTAGHGHFELLENTT